MLSCICLAAAKVLAHQPNNDYKEHECQGKGHRIQHILKDGGIATEERIIPLHEPWYAHKEEVRVDYRHGKKPEDSLVPGNC